MKITQIILIFMLFAILFLAGCTQQGEMNVNVHTGTQGLVVEPLKNSPPQEIYEGESFKIVARLINEGAYPITDGILVLTLEKDFIDLNGNEKINFQLDGKDAFNTWNDEKIVSYDLTAKKLDKMSEKHESVLFLTACYDYETIASFDICIDTNPYNKKSAETFCEATTTSSSGQGGPIVVSSVEQDISEEIDSIRPLFNIVINNRGKGDVITPGSEEMVCSSGEINKENFNTLVLEEVEFSNYKKSRGQITCSPQVIKLYDSEAKIRCSLDSGLISKTSPSYITSLKIHLRYGYTETEIINLDIKNDPAFDEATEGNEQTSASSAASVQETQVGTKVGYKCNAQYSSFDCYYLSNSAECPSGFHDIVGYCSGPTNIRCCIK